MPIPIFMGKSNHDLCQVLVEATVALQGKETAEGKKTIEDNKNTLGPERTAELQKPVGVWATLKNKLGWDETPATDMKNNMGPK
jgi:hypothetical protein